MTIEELLVLLDTQTESEFVERQLLSRRPWIFEADDAYHAWRSSVAATLRIGPDNIRIVGSAATGYSLSPLKPGRPFRKASTLDASSSDIDIAFVDPTLFAAAWDTIVLFDRTYRLGGAYETRSKIRIDIYWGLVGQQSLPRNTEPARMLLTAMSVAGRLPPLRGYRIRNRVYRRLDDLHAYHTTSLRQLRALLANA
jgi:hypothetical protein